MPWRLLTRLGHVVEFATEHGGHPARGRPATARRRDLRALGAAAEPKAFYAEMQARPGVPCALRLGRHQPRRIFNGLLLPGGHTPGCVIIRRVRCCGGRSPALGARSAGRRDLSRRAGARSSLRPSRGPRAVRPAYDLPTEVHGRSAFFATPWSSVATTARIPRTSKTKSARAPRDPADFVRGRGCSRNTAPRPTIGPPSVSRTTTTCRRAGPATLTCSPNGSRPGWNVTIRSPGPLSRWS